MGIPELEPNGTHLVYLVLSFFLILYALFAEFIRNRLHLSEPPLATLAGIAFGPEWVDVMGPVKWRFEDTITQELARVVTGVQVFAVGLDLPASYVKRHWKSIALLLGPNMIFGWFSSAFIIWITLGLKWTTCLIISACLTPTDPVLSASVLGEARFSQRVPKRLRHILAAESGCNDGTAFPFLYSIVLYVTQSNAKDWSKMFFLEVLLWQCLAGVAIGATIGLVANRALKFSEKHNYTQEATLFVFYFLLAIFSVGVGSTLGLDDFLVAFSAGVSFTWDGWFHTKTKKMKLPSILDLLLNSTMFVYLGTIMPWNKLTIAPLNPWKLIACVILILLFRRLPSALALKRFLPEVKTWSEALFVGHFGPMGVGAVFLAIEARARLETGTSSPLPHPPKHPDHHEEAIRTIWPVVSCIVIGSIMVHGFSAAIMSVYGHLTRDPKERASLLGAEEQRLYGMANTDSTWDTEQSGADDDSSSSMAEDEIAEATGEDQARERQRRIRRSSGGSRQSNGAPVL